METVKVNSLDFMASGKRQSKTGLKFLQVIENMERETRIELATNNRKTVDQLNLLKTGILQPHQTRLFHRSPSLQPIIRKVDGIE